MCPVNASCGLCEIWDIYGKSAASQAGGGHRGQECPARPRLAASLRVQLSQKQTQTPYLGQEWAEGGVFALTGHPWLCPLGARDMG